MAGKYLDFAAIKEATSIDEAARILKLDVKERGNQLRGVCPKCATGGDRALAITPSRQSFYCFAAGEGGDVIALVAHIQGVSMKEAAQYLADRSSYRSPTVPAEGEGGKGSEGNLQPLPYLQYDHEAVHAVGFDPKDAEALGIGYAPKGIMRGYVAIPIRTETGHLTGYIGIQEAKLPPSFQLGNVVKFPKSA